MKAVTDKLRAFIVAIRQLAKSLKRGRTELEKAMRNYRSAQEASEKAAKGKKAAERKSRKSSKKSDTPLEAFQEKGTQIISMAIGGEEFNDHDYFSKDDAIDDMQPYIVTGVKWAMDMAASQDIAVLGPVAKSIKLFNDDFRQSDLRKTAGRCMRANVDEESMSDAASQDYLLAKCLPLCPKGSLAVNSIASGDNADLLKRCMCLSNFGVKQGSHHAYIEKGKLWSIRVAIEGMRVMAVTPAASLCEFMKEKNITQSSAPSFLKGMRAESTEEYTKKHPLYWATLGPGDLLFTPYGYVIYENVHDGADVLGLRAGIAVSRDKRGVQEAKKEAEAPATPEQSVCKQLVGLLSSAETKV